MNITEINEQDRVLVKTAENQTEVAEVKAIWDNGEITLRLSDNKRVDVTADKIIKVFTN